MAFSLLNTKVWPIQCTRNDQNRPCFYTKRIKTTLDNIFSRPLPSPNPSFSHRNNVTQSGKKRRAFFSSPLLPPPRREERGERGKTCASSLPILPTDRVVSKHRRVEWRRRREEERRSSSKKARILISVFALCGEDLPCWENHLLNSSEALKPTGQITSILAPISPIIIGEFHVIRRCH